MTDYVVVDLGGMEVTETTPVVAGPRGRSAYEVAVTAGFSGTELEWLDSLQGIDGDDGLDGDSAYEVAVANGFVGTEAEWLASLAAEGGGAVDSVNGLVGAVVLAIPDSADDIGAETPAGAQAKVDTHATDTTAVHGIADTAALATTADVSAASTADRARANHTGTQSADTLTDGTTNKAFLATERTKLAGVATGATANDTDANLKNRANHTGTQAASTITGLGTAATVNTGTASGNVPLLGTGGLLPIARIASGTADGTKFVRDDGTLATPAGTGGGGSSLMTPNAQTTDYTLVAADAGKVIEETGVATVTVPANSSVAFPIGTIVNVYQAGAGTVSIGAAPGVTIRNLAPLAGQYAEASLRKRATDEWVLTGDLAMSNVPLLKDYAEVTRTAGDVGLASTAVSAVSTTLDLTIAAASGDLVGFGISGLLSGVAQSVVFDVYTAPSGPGGAIVNPFGAGLAAGAATLAGLAGLETTSVMSTPVQLNGEYTRILTSGDVTAGVTTLRLMYTKPNTTARTLFAQTNIPLKVWTKNYGPA